MNKQISAGEDVEKKGTLTHCWKCIGTGAATVENSMEVSQKIKNGTVLWPRDSTSGYIFKEIQNTNLKEYMHPYVHCSVFTVAKIWKQPKCPPIENWIKKKWYIHTMEYYLVIKNNEILPFATSWMDLQDIMLSEISQKEKTNTM